MFAAGAHLISRQIRVRTVRDEPAWAGTGAIRRPFGFFWLMSLTPRSLLTVFPFFEKPILSFEERVGNVAEKSGSTTEQQQNPTVCSACTDNLIPQFRRAQCPQEPNQPDMYRLAPEQRALSALLAHAWPNVKLTPSTAHGRPRTAGRPAGTRGRCTPSGRR